MCPAYMTRKRPLQLRVLLRYLMVDIVVNDVMSTSTSPDYSLYMFKNSVRVSHYCTSGSNLGFLVGLSSVLSDTVGKHH